MAECKNCHAEIPDGMEYCEECEEKNRIKADESYLDSLLNSVISDTPPTRVINRNQNNESQISKVPDVNSYAPVESGKDVDEYNIFDNNDDEFLESVFNDTSVLQDTDESMLFQDALQPEPDNTEYGIENDSDNNAEDYTERIEDDSPPLSELSESELEDALNIPSISTVTDIESDPPPDIPDMTDIEKDSSIPSIPDMPDIPDIPDIPDFSGIDQDLPSQNEEAPSSINDLDILNMDYFNSVDDGTNQSKDGDISSQNLSDHPEEDAYKSEEDLALADLLENFQDSVDVNQVVESIESGDFDKELMDLIPEEEKVKKGTAKKKKKGFFTRVFGNVKEDLTEEQLEQKRKKEAALEENRKKQAEEKEKQKNLSKEEKKKLKEEAAAEKKAEAEKAKVNKAAADKLKKEQAEEKAKLKKEKKLAVLQIEEDPGRINRVGTTILLIFFSLLALFIIYGTNFYSYRVSIKSAETNFDRQRYNEAYKDVYGLDIRDEDITLYDKIMTVMYVNKQLNSYNNYYAIGMKAEALDSLIKGLSRYEKYISLATSLGIVQDMNIVRDRILNELEKVFEISESTAMSLVEIDEQADYTMEVFSLLKSK